MLFTEDIWTRWAEQESKNYKLIQKKSGGETRKYLKKGYLHFDPKFWFPKRQDEVKRIIQGGLKVYHKVHGRMENYAFRPFTKILISTPRYKETNGEYHLETKIRPICYAAHLDSLIFSFYAFALNEKYQEFIKKNGVNEAVLAYRTDLDGKCNIQFAKEIFDEVKRRGQCTAIALDIKGYFDHIDHEQLKDKWQEIIGGLLPDDQFLIYKRLTKYSYTSKNSILRKYGIKLKKAAVPPETFLDIIPGATHFSKFQRLRDDKLIVTNDKPDKKLKSMIGIPQGSAMSALLSNIYLIGYDEMMVAKGKKEGFMYRRYCDDIMIICDSAQAGELQKFAIEKIDKDCRLEIQPRKVELTEFRENSKKQIRAFNKKKLLKENIIETDQDNEQRYYKSLQYLGFEFNGQDIFIRASSLSRYFIRNKARIIKTVSMAYSETGKSDRIFKEKLFHRYTHLGKRNFLKYAYNAASATYQNEKGETKEGLNSKAIKKQLSRHFDHLVNTLKTKNEQRHSWKGAKAPLLKQV
jgi:RNA-directed DNA polymerase